MPTGVAGTLESNDCIITVQPSEATQIVIHSVVDAFYHEQIEKVIRKTLKEKKMEKVRVVCDDKGALDYAIEARLLTAITRMEADHD